MRNVPLIALTLLLSASVSGQTGYLSRHEAKKRFARQERWQRVVREDYNFDGKKDFVFYDSTSSGWRNGPAYEIWLAEGEGFRLSEELTQLRNSVVSLKVDRKHKQLSTLNGGAGEYYTTIYEVRDNLPVEVEHP